MSAWRGIPSDRSIRTKVLFPLLVLGLAAAAGVGWWAYNTTSEHLMHRQRIQAEIMANAVNYEVETATSSGQIQRFVAAIGAEPEVNLIVVVGGEPARVIASTKNEWRDRLLDEISANEVKEVLHNIIQGRQRGTVSTPSSESVIFTAPLLLSQPEVSDRSLINGAVLIELDLHRVRRVIAATGRDVGLSVGSLSIILYGVAFFLLHRRVLRPIADIARAANDWQQGTQRGTDLQLSKDEIGMLGRTLEKTFHDLQQARDAALESARLKSQFLANMSHEIRTPINGVMGMADLLLEAELTQQQHEYVSIISKSSESLLSVINDILDFSKIEAGKLTFEMLDFDLGSVLESTMEVQAEGARSKSLEFASVIDGNVPIYLRGDPGRLRQVLTNLIGNGIKFTESGSVVVRVTLERETVSETMVKFAVTDSGIGITPEDQGSLFEAFAQVDGSTTRQFGGTGLGLAICKRLVEYMNGNIGVESVAGKGSIFWFTALFPKQTPNAIRKIPSSLQDLSVLVVDSKEVRRGSVVEQLRQFGARARGVACETEAIERAQSDESGKGHLGIALVHHDPRGQDGVAAARKILSRSTHSPLPIILTGSIRDRPDPIVLQAARITAFLSEPLKQVELLKSVSAALEGSNQSVPAPLAIPSESMTSACREIRTTGEYRVLVAEDNLVNQRVIVSQLEKLGVSIAELVTDGLQALEAHRREPFHLIIMDCQMPRIDGLEVTRRIRALAGLRPYIIALTAHAMKGDREKCLEAGMDDYLTKPLKMRELQLALEKWREPAGKSI